MLTIDGKELRNLEEQVQANKDRIDNLISSGGVLDEFGIKVVGEIDDISQLPDASTYQGEYGDAYAIGTQPPYTLYVWTRANETEVEDHWFNIGEFPAPGPQGLPGLTGATGPQGVRGSLWTTGTQPSNANVNDQYLDYNGQVYQYNGNSWVATTNIKGAQGVQGLQGIQGPQGAQGAQGPKGETGAAGTPFTIIGELTSTNQLPDPETASPNEAYLITTDNYLYVVVGTTGNKYWRNIGQVQGVQGPVGPQGPQGPEGPQGIQGIQGQIGPQGLQGERGIQGPKGDTGARGPQGIQGPQGPQGPIGEGITDINNESIYADMVLYDNLNGIEVSGTKITIYGEDNTEDSNTIDYVLPIVSGNGIILDANETNTLAIVKVSDNYINGLIDTKLAGGLTFKVEIVASLPEVGEEGIIYFVGTEAPYEEYMYINNRFEIIGYSGQLDLSNYVTETELSTTLSNYSNNTQLDSKLNTKLNDYLPLTGGIVNNVNVGVVSGSISADNITVSNKNTSKSTYSEGYWLNLPDSLVPVKVISSSSLSDRINIGSYFNQINFISKNERINVDADGNNYEIAYLSDIPSLDNYYNKSEIDTTFATKASLNDYITTNTLTNYYTKTETYNRSEVNDLISNLTAGVSFQVVTQLPTSDISTSTIYLLAREGSTNNAYDEYMYINNTWEIIGTTEVDLSDYSTTAEISQLLNNKINKTTATNQLYGTNSIGAQTSYTLSSVVTANTIPQRDTSGNIQVSTAIGPYDAINKTTLETELSDYTLTSTLDTRLNNKSISVVSALPETVDENTIYFVTGA